MAKLKDPPGSAARTRSRSKKPYKAGDKASGAAGSASKVERSAVRPGTKQALLIDLLRRKQGVTIDEISEATGWQAHSVRGAISGTIRKKLGLIVASEVVEDRGRVYRIPADG